MLRRIAVVGGSGALGALALALVQIRVGALFGTSRELDAFFVGAALPSVLLAIAAGATFSLVVPRLPRDAAAVPVAGRFATLAALLGAAVALFVVAAAPLIVTLVAPGLDGPTTNAATDVLRLYAISIPPSGVAFVFAAYAYSIDRPYVAGLTTALYGLTWLALLSVDAFTDDAADVALAGVIATGGQLLFAMTLASSRGAIPWPAVRGLRLSRAALAAVATVLAATIVGRVVLLLDPLFGSLLDPGSVSQLSFATRITLLAVFVCGQGAAFSLLVVTRDRDAGSDHDARTGIVVPLLLSLAAAVVFAFVGPALAELILARGELSASEAREIGELLRLYAPAVVVITMIWALEAVLFAAHRGDAVLRRALAGLGVNLLASAALVAVLDVEGRPLGVLAGYSVQLAALLWLMRDDERVAVLGSALTVRSAALLVGATAASTAAAYALGNTLLPSEWAAAVACGVAALVTIAFVRRYGAAAGARAPSVAPVPQ